jgi:hypothetical protein
MATRMGGMVETACRNIASWSVPPPGLLRFKRNDA